MTTTTHNAADELHRVTRAAMAGTRTPRQIWNDFMGVAQMYASEGNTAQADRCWYVAGQVALEAHTGLAN